MIQIKQISCPGSYCGREVLLNGTLSECGGCPRGFRVNSESICEECTHDPSLYQCLYLGFMALLVPMMHSFFIDFTNKNKQSRLLLLHLSSLIECAISLFCTLLIIEPRGSLSIRACEVRELSDWYTLFFNPKPDYVHTLHCSQEAVYPLYTMVLMYYAFCTISMLLLRPWISSYAVFGRGTDSIYAALYALPILGVAHAAFAGLIYYSFPYILVIVSVVTLALHLSTFRVQKTCTLITSNTRHYRNAIIIIMHWILHAYAILSITELKNPTLHGPLLLLVPVPFFFYVLTVNYSDPEKLYLAITE